MLTLINVAHKAERLVRENTPAILTALGVTGTITTAYLAGQASFEASKIIQYTEERTGTSAFAKQRLKERAPQVWRLYIPAAVSGAVTITCIIGAAKVSSRRTAALTAAYSLTDHAFSEYKEKVIETLGENKEQKIRDEIAQDQVTKTPPKEVVVLGTGQVLCCELHTKRYFNSDMESLRKAQNDVNALLVRHDHVTMSQFYDLVGLSHTSYSWELGWQSDKLMELEFSTVMSEDNKPCIAFDYNYTKLI